MTVVSSNVTTDTSANSTFVSRLEMLQSGLGTREPSWSYCTRRAGLAFWTAEAAGNSGWSDEDEDPERARAVAHTKQPRQGPSGRPPQARVRLPPRQGRRRRRRQHRRRLRGTVRQLGGSDAGGRFGLSHPAKIVQLTIAVRVACEPQMRELLRRVTKGMAAAPAPAERLVEEFEAEIGGALAPQQVTAQAEEIRESATSDAELEAIAAEGAGAIRLSLGARHRGRDGGRGPLTQLKEAA